MLRNLLIHSAQSALARRRQDEPPIVLCSGVYASEFSALDLRQARYSEGAACSNCHSRPRLDRDNMLVFSRFIAMKTGHFSLKPLLIDLATAAPLSSLASMYVLVRRPPPQDFKPGEK